MTASLLTEYFVLSAALVGAKLHAACQRAGDDVSPQDRQIFTLLRHPAVELWTRALPSVLPWPSLAAKELEERRDRDEHLLAELAALRRYRNLALHHRMTREAHAEAAAALDRLRASVRAVPPPPPLFDLSVAEVGEGLVAQAIARYPNGIGPRLARVEEASKGLLTEAAVRPAPAVSASDLPPTAYPCVITGPLLSGKTAIALAIAGAYPGKVLYLDLRRDPFPESGCALLTWLFSQLGRKVDLKRVPTAALRSLRTLPRNEVPVLVLDNADCAEGDPGSRDQPLVEVLPPLADYLPLLVVCERYPNWLPRSWFHLPVEQSSRPSEELNLMEYWRRRTTTHPWPPELCTVVLALGHAQALGRPAVGLHQLSAAVGSFTPRLLHGLRRLAPHVFVELTEAGPRCSLVAAGLADFAIRSGMGLPPDVVARIAETLGHA